MISKTFTFGSAASLALAGALVIATPASAQRESTPAEHAATSALNVHAGVVTHVDAAAELEHARAQAEYQQKLEAHNAEIQRFQDAERMHEQAQRTHAQNAETYQRELSAYERERQLYELDAGISQPTY